MIREIKQQIKPYDFFRNIEDREEINPKITRGEGGGLKDDGTAKQ